MTAWLLCGVKHCAFGSAGANGARDAAYKAQRIPLGDISAACVSGC
jgi:hypothetical protein